MCSGDFGQFYCVVGSSSPLFFTGFLQAKVIKRVIRMLKTDVNNRNETAVTDERLGQERAQLVQMTPLPRSQSPPPPRPLFSFGLSPLLTVALGGRPGTRRSKLHSGRRSAAAISGVASLGSRRFAHRWASEAAAGSFRGPPPDCEDAGRRGPSPAARARAPRLRPGRGVSAAAARSSHPRGCLRAFVALPPRPERRGLGGAFTAQFHRGRAGKPRPALGASGCTAGEAAQACEACARGTTALCLQES